VSGSLCVSVCERVCVRDSICERETMCVRESNCEYFGKTTHMYVYICIESI